MNFTKRITAIIFIGLIFCSNLLAQSISKGFNFYLPAADTATNGDISLMPLNPIGSNAFVSIDNNGHFSVGGQRKKFWGGNLVAGGAFPEKNKSWYIAGRLRKLGFNLVRLHHMDNPWNDESLFQYGQDTRHLNPVTIDELEYLLQELKKNGIYVDVNLNVSRGFNSLDGVAGADSVTNMFKGVTIFDPQLIYLEKEYAKQLLTHINPYTGLSLVNDPVMAMVEMINENSLYRMWSDDKLKPITMGGDLLFRHSVMLDTMWNSYLINKYSTTSNLEAAWNSGNTITDSANLLKDGNFENPYNSSSWYMELDNPAASATMTRDTSTSYESSYSAKAIVKSVSGTGWHIQWKQTGFSLKKDSVYTVVFAARTDTPKTITVATMRENSPYTYYSGQNFSLTTLWQVFSFNFKSTEDNQGEGRLSFQFNNNTGNYWFDAISIIKASNKGLLPDESLESNNIKRISYSDCQVYSNNRVKDIANFYIKLQADFYREMKNYLKDTLGVKVPIVGTNWIIGAGDLISQSEMDYIDNHSYWDHPSFPNIPWSLTDWFIQNQPMVKAADGGIIPGLFGGIGITGKPFTISEYNHPYPNVYQSEGVLFLAAYSSFHDVDAIMFFDYAGSAGAWDEDILNGYFDINRNNVMMSLMPSCSYAFRNNLISKANQVITLNYTKDTVLILPKFNTGYAPSYFSQKLALLHEVRNASFNSTASSNFEDLNPVISPPYITDTKEIIYDTNGLLSIDTKNFIGVAGFLNKYTGKQIGNLQIKNADGFGTLTWLSLTGDSLGVARKSLMTLSSIQQNTGMNWDGTTSVHNNWGSAPTLIYPLTIKLDLKIKADSVKVFPLNVNGTKDSLVYYLIKGVENLFEVNLNQNNDKTLWYSIEAYGDGNLINYIDNGSNTIKEFKLEQNYPNPFNPSTMINYSVPKIGFVTIKVYNILGKEVASLVNEKKSVGNYSVQFSVNDGYARGGNNSKLSSGVYFYRMSAGSFIATRKFILLK
jgi:hypothetical protein